MDPFFARNRLSAYLDGSLPEGEAAEVEAAIRNDPALQAEYDAMRRAVALLRREGPVEAPPDFHAKVMAAVADEPAPGKVTGIFHRVFASVPVEAVALAAAAVIVVMVIQGRGEEAASPDAAFSEEVADVRPSSSSTPPTVSLEGGSGKDTPPPAPQAAGDAAQAAAPAAQADGNLRTAPGSLDDASTGSAPASRSEASLQAKGASTKEKKAAPQQKSRGSATPEEPYYAGWEQTAQSDEAAEAEAEADTPSELYEGIEMARPFAYRISLADAQVLFQLSAVAEQGGGRLTGTDGAGLSPTELSAEDGWTRVHLVVPRDEAQSVHAQLQALQAQATPPPSTPVLYGSDHAVFVIDVNAGR